MRAAALLRPALSAAVALSLVLPAVEPHVAEQQAPVAYRPNVALTASSAPLPPPFAAVYHVVTEADSPTIVVRDSAEGATPATPLTPIDVVDAIAAAGYLLVAGPLLVISIPLQLITGQSDAVITSLNDLISAANTILKLVGQAIPPIPTPSAGDVEDTPAIEAEPEPETNHEPAEEPEDTAELE